MAGGGRRSALQYQGPERSLQRAWLKGAGYTDEELERPLVGIVNTYQDFAPENIHLREVSAAVKAGIYMAGATPCEFNAFHVVDCLSFASEGMRYVLPSRDLIADLIELMAEGHRLDALVLLSSGDKVVPGMVMAAARLDLPALLLYGGPTRAGTYNEQKVFLETVYDGVGQYLRGAITREHLMGLEEAHIPGPGGSDTASSGNSAGIYTEALGLALPGTGTLPAGGAAQLWAAKRAGMRIVELLQQQVRTSRILTMQAFENAMRVGLAVGGSTNMVLHFTAMAKEADIDIGFDDWDRLSRETPLLTKLAPSGPWGVTDLGDAGGVPAVMKALGDRIERNCLSIAGQTIGEIADAAVIRNPKCLRSSDAPLEHEGAIYILKGSLAPEGSVVKASGINRSMWKTHLSARVFEDEETADRSDPDRRHRAWYLYRDPERRHEGRARHA